MNTTTVRAAAALALLLPLAVLPAAAQPLARQVERAPDGEVSFTFPAQPDLCGDGTSVIARRGPDGRLGSTTVYARSWNDRDRGRLEEECRSGPVRVALRVASGRVAGVRAHVGPVATPHGATDLGAVDAREAADYLIALASSPNEAAAKDAVFPATLAADVDVWPAMLRLARNERASRQARKQALFWMGQAAGRSVGADLGAVAADDAVDREVREQAIFALSQLRDGQGVPVLIQTARTNRDPRLRQRALFWLAQSEDPRALSLFEEILVRN